LLKEEIAVKKSNKKNSVLLESFQKKQKNKKNVAKKKTNSNMKTS